DSAGGGPSGDRAAGREPSGGSCTMTKADSFIARTFTRQLPFGAQFDARQGTTFRLCAPGEDRVSLAMENGDSIAMTRGPDGLFEARVHCSAGTRYRYRLCFGALAPVSLSPPATPHGPTAH